MKSRSSVVKFAGSVGLLLTLTQTEVSAIANKAKNSQQLAADIQNLSGEYAEAFSESEIQSLLDQQAESLVDAENTQKTNIDRKHKKHHKHHHKHPKGAALVQDAPAEKPKQPRANNFMSTKSKTETHSRGRSVDVPIDEVRAITLDVAPTYSRDTVESVTLKSFRKIVGYDTFNSILKKSRDEGKDQSDYYNVTVSMMIKRVPEPTAAPKADKYNGGTPLANRLDKGFPYDDGDNTIDDQTPNWKNPKAQASTIVGKLNGENVTKESLVNLVKDTTAPVTVGLVQLDSEKSDGDVLSALLGENVTRGALKNLVTDKPAPITVSLAQTQGNDGAILSSLLGENVTRGALKNLVTDKPAPITVALAQMEKNDLSLMDNNVTIGALKNLVTDKPAPITVALAQQKPKNATALAQGEPVYVNPVVMQNTEANTNLGLDMKVGGDSVSVLAHQAPNATKFDAPKNASKFDAANNASKFQAPANKSAFDAHTNKTAFNAPKNASSFDAPKNASSFNAPKNASSFDEKNVSKFDAPKNASSFDAPKNASKFDAPKNASSFDEKNASKFEAPANVSKFDVPKNASFEAPKNASFDAPKNASSFAQGVPVHVNPVVMQDTMGSAKLGMNIKVGADDVSLKK